MTIPRGSKTARCGAEILVWIAALRSCAHGYYPSNHYPPGPEEDDQRAWSDSQGHHHDEAWAVERVATKKNIHVVKSGDAWKVKVEGNSRASAVTGTQKESIAKARELGRANSAGAELNIHGVDGKIRAKDSVPPATDPRNTPG
ncbi:hypothetical protein CBI38_36925 (plasmid) [Rhodococcus oxybenzonivorans]|uniref:DUF2188 domain-containing protein n=2 Tax=Nocardiaceae TaxID=85025 RepID=A0A2S2C806_9NOCA|nr:hypothetical protein CBI38_36925 [Rhodococcus oxybenzonivorans]QTJ71362.1 DUF2188 domain-containing protein [Rhodococcus sp. ZPP]